MVSRGGLGLTRTTGALLGEGDTRVKAHLSRGTRAVPGAPTHLLVDRRVHQGQDRVYWSGEIATAPVVIRGGDRSDNKRV